LKEIAARHQNTTSNADGQAGATADDMQRPPRATTDEDAAVKRGTPEKHDGKQAAGDYEQQLEAMEKRIKELENEKFHLLIDKSAKEQVITTLREHMTEDRKDYTAQITHFAHRVGKLETEMRQLKAPDRDRGPTPDDSRRPLDDDAAIDAEYRDANATTHVYHNDVSTNASQA
jgi:chromosome segregation ATPase